MRLLIFLMKFNQWIQPIFKHIILPKRNSLLNPNDLPEMNGQTILLRKISKKHAKNIKLLKLLLLYQILPPFKRSKLIFKALKLIKSFKNTWLIENLLTAVKKYRKFQILSLILQYFWLQKEILHLEISSKNHINHLKTSNNNLKLSP